MERLSVKSAVIERIVSLHPAGVKRLFFRCQCDDGLLSHTSQIHRQPDEPDQRNRMSGTGRQVAVKILPHHLVHDPSSVARFLREAHILAQLNHPNIVHIYDAG